MAPGAIRLLRHDGLIFGRSFLAAFSTWRDGVLLLLVGPIALLWLRDAVLRGRHLDNVWLALGAGILAGAALGRLLRRRLAFHAAEGLLAADALSARSAWTYFAVACGPAFFLLVGIGWTLSPTFVPALAGGASAGAIFAAAAPPVGPPALGRRGSSARPGLGVALLLSGFSAASVLAAAWLRSREAALAVTAGASLLCQLALIRIDPGTCRFFALAGIGPLRSLALQLAPAAAAAMLVALLVLLILGPSGALVAFGVGALSALIASARIWLYQLYAKPAADWLLTIALAAIAMTSLALPPLALLLIPMMLAGLYGRAAASVWAMK